MEADVTAACGTCRANRGELVAPGGIIYDDGLWRLEHTIEPIPMVGWLVLKPLRHIESIAEMSAEESAAFGPLAQRITTAIDTVLHPAKVYLCMFAEAEHFAHIHFHLIPRFPDTPPERRGPGAFEYLREAISDGRNRDDVREAERIAQLVREQLALVRE